MTTPASDKLPHLSPDTRRRIQDRKRTALFEKVKAATRPAPTIPLYPGLSSTTPGTINLAPANVYLLGSQALNHLLTGGPALSDFDIPDLIAAQRELYYYHINEVSYRPNNNSNIGLLILGSQLCRSILAETPPAEFFDRDELKDAARRFYLWALAIEKEQALEVTK